jgi:hypothetical protein
MTLVTQAVFSRMCRTSRKTVTRWKQEGRLVMRGQEVDVEATAENMKRTSRRGSPIVLTPEEAAAPFARSRVTRSPAAQKAVPTSHPDIADLSAAPQYSAREDETPEQAAERIVLTGAPFKLSEAERIKENYLALLKKLEYEQKEGSLIELAVAERVLFECARADRDAWLNWPARVGPLIAADLGLEADRVTGILTEHVHKQIAQLGEPDPDFARAG